MLQMEGLIQHIVASPLFKDQLQKQFQQLSRKQSKPYQQSITISSLIEEVSSYITEITEFTLEEENSKNYITFMKRNQQLYLELEMRIKNDVDDIVTTLKEEIKSLTNKMNSLATGPVERLNVESKLKQERKMLTQNLLEASRLHNNLAEENLNIKKTFKNIKSTIQHSENKSQCEGSSAILSESSRHKLSQVMEEWRNMTEEWSSVQATMSRLKKEQESQRQQWTNASKMCQAKIQANLQSIWNVISDLCSRISKFQSTDVFQSSP